MAISGDIKKKKKTKNCALAQKRQKMIFFQHLGNRSTIIYDAQRSVLVSKSLTQVRIRIKFTYRAQSISLRRTRHGLLKGLFEVATGLQKWGRHVVH